MAIRSTFYDTTPGEGVKETSWAQSAQSRGALYGVVGAGDLALTPHATTPYAVNLSAGKFWGHGVWDESTGVSLVQSATPPSGVVWWTLIAVRRDWQPTGGGPTSFVSIPGGSTATIPAGRENRPGVVDDQPLYLVKWKGGNPQPEQIIDLRCWASNGGVEVADKLALSYLEAPGATVKLGLTTWRYESQGNGVWGWASYALTTSVGLAGSTGWGVVGEVERIGGSASAVRLRAAVRLQRLGGPFSVSSTGGFTPLTGAILPEGYRPVSRSVDIPAALTSAANTWGGTGVARLGMDGVVNYLPLQPAQQTIGTGACFHISAEWFAV